MGDGFLSPLHELFFRHPHGERHRQSDKLRGLSTLLLSGFFNVQAVPFLGKKGALHVDFRYATGRVLVCLSP